MELFRERKEKSGVTANQVQAVTNSCSGLDRAAPRLPRNVFSLNAFRIFVAPLRKGGFVRGNARSSDTANDRGHGARGSR